MPDSFDSRYSTSRSYNFKVTIGNLDYSGDLTNLKIISSISRPYQVFELTFLLDPTDVIIADKDGNGLFGQKTINLSTILIGQDEVEKESIDYELVCIGVLQTKLPIRPLFGEDKKGTEKERAAYRFTGVPKEAFKTMNTFVNKTYFGKNMKEILTDLLENIAGLSKDNYYFDEEYINSNTFEQVILPPTTLNNTLKYLDETFGIYSGPLCYFCDFENITYILNLATWVNLSPAFTIYHLATDSDESVDLQKKTLDGEHFISYSPIRSDYAGNTKFAVLSKNPTFILKPSDDLYLKVEKDLTNICSKNGIIYKSDYIFLDPTVEQRKRYFTEFTGYEKDDTMVISYLSSEIANLTYTSVDLSGNLPLDKLFDVGNSVKLETQTVQYQGVSGNYILHSTEISFIKKAEWDSLATVNLIRTNKLIN